MKEGGGITVLVPSAFRGARCEVDGPLEVRYVALLDAVRAVKKGETAAALATS